MIDEYFKLQKEIFEYFSYREDWVVIPLVDHREYYWHLEQDEEGFGEINYYDEPMTIQIIEDGDYYSAEIYTQRFLPKWVYKTEEHTLICMDTRVDGNKFLGIFDNKKEMKI